MAYQKITKTSYGGRLKNALGGVLAGFIMLIAAIVLLFWNEGRTVKTTRMLKEAQKVCVELGDPAEINAVAEGKMVHASGFAGTDEILTDAQFGISLNAIKLSRNAEYYQWVEHQSSQTKDKVGGGQETVTTYTYSKEWVSSPVNSADFEDPQYKGINNEVLLKVENQTLQAKNVGFGAYKLPDGLVSQMSRREDLAVELAPEIVSQYEADFHREFDVPETESFVHADGNVLYLGLNPNKPTVGDVRVTYCKVLPGDVSILAVARGNSFEKFTAKNGYSFWTLEDGTVSKESMFESEHSGNKAIAWILRIVGILLMIFGIKNIFNIITALLKVLPFLGNIANLGIGLVSGILGFALSLVIIAIAWIVYRPVLGIILLVVAVALIFFLGKKSKEKAASAAPAEPAPQVAE